MIDPGPDVTVARRAQANEPDRIDEVLGGEIQAIEVETGAVLWVDENGKRANRATNLLATRSPTGFTPDSSPTTPATAEPYS